MERLDRRLTALGRAAGRWVDEEGVSTEADVVAEARKRFVGSLAAVPERQSSAVCLLSGPTPNVFDSERQRSNPLLAALAGVLEYLGIGPTRPARLRFAVVAAGACMVSVLALVAVSLRAPSPITFAIRANEPGRVGDWVETRQARVDLSFSEGTRLSVAPNTKLAVERTTAQGAELRLARGRAVAAVNHRPGADWRVHAGPFMVRVTGTEFEVAWTPATDTFELMLRAGSVVVTGPTLAGQYAVRTGESLRVSLRGSPAEASQHAEERAVDPSSTPPVSDPTERAPVEAKDQPTSPETAVAIRPRGQEPGWREALQQGHRSDAIELIERSGASGVFASASPSELYAISDAARLERRPGLATQALLALRSRHGARGQTAYLLGKIAADQLRSRTEAAQWFETYLRESPKGALAEQALGRLIELQSGSPSGQKAALRYLERYPNGAYAALARRVAGRPSR